MSVSVQTLKGLERQMTVTIPSGDIDVKVDKKLHELTGKVKLPGFRPGKVPFKVVQQRYALAVRDEVINDLVKDTYIKALDEEKIKPAGYPTIEPAKEENEDKSFTYTAKFEVFPEVEVKNFAKIKLELLKSEITDADIQEAIERVQKQQGEWKDSDAAVAKGDRVTVDYQAEVAGEINEKESAKDSTLVIGNNIMLDGFEDALVGAKTGDEVKIKLAYPKDFADEALKGKKVVFTVKVNKVEKQALPAVDEEFIKKMGVEAGTEEALRTEIRTNLERELKYGTKDHTKKLVIDKLLEEHEFDIPAALVEQESRRMQQQSAQYFQQQMPKGSKIPEMPLDVFKNDAEKQVRIGLLLSAIIEQNELKADDDKVSERVADIATMYDDPEEAKNWLYKNQNQLENIKGQVLEDQVIQLVIESAKIKDKQVSYQELVKAVQSR